MPTVLRALLLAVVLTVIPVAVGVSTTSTHRAAAPPSYSPTKLSDYDTTTVSIARAPFCHRVPAEAVSAALGGPAKSTDSYVPGQRRQVGKSSDVLHEYGCRFTAGQVSARAWVFAPPVTASAAADVIKASDKGCKRPTHAPAYGRPTTASLCGGKVRTATFRGLFGDAWLSCSLTEPKGRLDDTALLDRAGEWCVAVAKAASAPAS